MSIDSFRAALIAAGMEANTDKISAHHYEKPYSTSLYRFRDKGPFAMLEIGYGSGAGVKFWKSLFPEAFIYCFDRDAEGEEDRVKVLKVDQSDLQGLQLAIEQMTHPIDLIIDDGSHHPSHQILTFSCLFPALLSDNGLYAIEDIETSYWRNGSLYGYAMNYGLNDPWSVMEAFKVAADYVNRRFLCEEDQSLLQYRMMSIGLDPQAVEMVESILFSRNCVILEKNDAAVQGLSPYQYSAESSRVTRL